jgi:hypothetical protein
MASDNKKTKTDAAPKAEAAAKKEAPAAKKNEVQPKDQAKDKAASDADPTKAEGGEKAAAPKGYSRGEGQKPVTQAYKDNWNAIYGKKKKR